MVWRVIVVAVILDMFVCYLYCSIRKARVKKENSVIQTGQKTGMEVSFQQRSNFKCIISVIYKKYRHIMDCILRPNLFVVGYIPSHHIRNFIYKHIFRVDIRKNAVIYYGTEIRAPWNICIGKGSIVGDQVILDGRHGIVIGENVNISTGVSIWTMQHDVNDPLFSTRGG